MIFNLSLGKLKVKKVVSKFHHDHKKKKLNKTYVINIFCDRAIQMVFTKVSRRNWQTVLNFSECIMHGHTPRKTSQLLQSQIEENQTLLKRARLCIT